MVRLTCKNCGNNFFREQRNGGKGKPKMYCSPRCRYDHMKGEEHPNYKGGRYVPDDKDRYVYVLCHDHPRAHNNYVQEHILVVEKIIGRRLRGKEEVHHKNGDKKDNRPENLHLCSGRKEHMILEKQALRLADTGSLSLRRCIYCKQVKQLDQFYNRKDSWDGKTNSCKECELERVKRYKKRI